jgi:5,10-methylenetetrahydromethanopterin reductase
MKDVYVGLAMTALRTSTMRLGTGVTNVVTRHPTITANAIAAIAELAPDRTLLGIGAGDSAVFGLGAKPSRLAEMEEAVRFFAAALSGATGTWAGGAYRLAQSVPRTPVYLAVAQQRMCRLAGRFADGAIIMGPAQPDLLERQIGWVEEGLAAEGRNRRDIALCFITTLSMRADREEALRDVRSWASAQARLQADVKELPESLAPFADEIARAKSGYDYSQHLSTRAEHQGTISDDLVRTLAIAGSPDEVVERVDALRRTGVDRLIFPVMGSRRRDRIDALIAHLAPVLS